MIWYFVGGVIVFLVLWACRDTMQRRHAIIHNFPVVGHLRYWLESIGPELRQYIVTDNNEELPFSRDQRSWVYSSSKKENNYCGFGTDNDLENSPNYLIIKNSAFPICDPQIGDDGYDPNHVAPCAKVLGGFRERRKAFRPQSIINISGMSFGSLSATAIEALNRGSELAGCLQNTGEGGVSPHHQHGGELIWQIGTAYFGCRDERGHFDISKFRDVIAENPIRAIEIKLSQGAKPGLGGHLLGSKITAEIGRIRGIPVGQDCISPSSHREFNDVDSLLDFVERLADESGLPVGIKSAVGEMSFWRELIDQMVRTNRGVDFVTIDGGEGGTGAAPMSFSDFVSLPFKLAFTRVYQEFARADIQQNVVFIGSGKLGFPETGLFAMAIGCDMLAVAREAMLSIGCIQALKCHTGHCPAGVATQNKWLMSGLDPGLKSVRMANYIITLRKEMLQLCRACGVPHPALLTADHFEVLDANFGSVSATNRFGYQTGWGLPSSRDQLEIRNIMTGTFEGAPVDDLLVEAMH